MGFWRHDVIQPALDSDVEAEAARQRATIKRDPTNAPAHFALGTLAHFAGRTEEAVALFLKAIELDPTYAAPHASLGRIAIAQRDYAAAWTRAREAELLGDRSLVEQLERYANPSQR